MGVCIALLLGAVSGVAAVVAFPVPASAAVSVGHSGWEWGNPIPQGNPLRSLDFIGSIGYAAGDYGTLLETDDDGTSWRGVATGTTEDLVRVRMIAPDSLVTAGGCSVRRSDDGAVSFRRLPWTSAEGRCRSPIASIAFPSTEIGYVLREDGRLYRSGDAGESWHRMTDVPGTEHVRGEAVATDLFFMGADEGVATTSDAAYLTTDGGFSWTPVAREPSGLNGVFFTSQTVGYAVGGASTLLKSTDGGLTWSPKQTGLGQATSLGSIRCASALVCLATIDGDERVLLTRDGGENWSLVRAAAGAVSDVAFASPTRVVVAGAGGLTAVSEDVGATWSSVGGGLPGTFNRLRGRLGTLAFALGPQGALARTADGGRSWESVPLPTAEDVVDVSFPDQTHGFVLDGAGSLLRTDDGGASWIPVYADATGQAQAVVALDESRVLLVGPRGIRRSFDGGLKFVYVRRRAVRRAALFDLDYAGGSLFAYGPTSLFASRDGGKTWKRLRRPDHRPLAAIDFVGPRIGVALGKGGRIWRTRNRGRSWRELLGVGTDGGVELAFSDARHGYVATRDLFFAKGANRPDYVLRTSDGGKSWRPQLVSESTDVSGLLATRDSGGLLLAGRQLLFATSSGGDTGDRSRLLLRAERKCLTGRGTVRIAGRLSPAASGEQVIVSMTAADPRHRKGAVDWEFKSAKVAADGRFSTTWKVRQTSVFVAQWTGAPGRMSAGSRVVKVRLRGP